VAVITFGDVRFLPGQVVVSVDAVELMELTSMPTWFALISAY
jgi:hypothetical protein